MNSPDASSTRPYLIRAMYEWCTDNGLTPYVAVAVDETVQVPREYVKNNEIVLNISFDATSSLQLGNDFIEFKARFAGSARDIMVPISRVIAIYARENGQGMAFPLVPPGQSGAPGLASPAPLTDGVPAGVSGEGVPAAAHAPAILASSGADSKIVHLVPTEGAGTASEEDHDPPDPPKPNQGIRPSLKRVK